MNIAVVTPYGNVYGEDRLFDESSCKIGENLLVPIIRLKESLRKQGHEFHTADMYNYDDIDVMIFQDINNDSRVTIHSPTRLLKYILKRKWRYDYLYKLSQKRIKSVLIAQEPPIVFPYSYDIRYHELFDYILTWDDDLVDGKKYHKFQYPQVKPESVPCIPFEEKKLISLISGNKKSKAGNELYSKRYEFIQFMEGHGYDLDLYGVGWQQEGFKCYRGIVERKHEVQSKYKFSLCYENMTGVSGYITEKIFDCLFSGSVPIYWGADNITDYIPKTVFIDRREFSANEELYGYISGMAEEEYKKYLEAGRAYLDSKEYYEEFSVESYIGRMTEIIRKLSGLRN